MMTPSLALTSGGGSVAGSEWSKFTCGPAEGPDSGVFFADWDWDWEAKDGDMSMVHDG